MVRYHEVKEAILHALHGRRAVPVAALATDVDAHPAVIDRCCSGLQRSGYIHQTAPGVYRLTSIGEERLSEQPPDRVGTIDDG